MPAPAQTATKVSPPKPGQQKLTIPGAVPGSQGGFTFYKSSMTITPSQQAKAKQIAQQQPPRASSSSGSGNRADVDTQEKTTKPIHKADAEDPNVENLLIIESSELYYPQELEYARREYGKAVLARKNNFFRSIRPTYVEREERTRLNAWNTDLKGHETAPEGFARHEVKMYFWFVEKCLVQT